MFDPLAVLLFIAYNKSIIKPQTQPSIITQEEKQPDQFCDPVNKEDVVAAEDEVVLMIHNPITGVGRKILST